MFRSILFLVLLVAGCGRSTVPLELPSPLQRAALQSALQAAQAAVPSEEAGWPSDSDCDGALWAGEARAAGITHVDVSAALQSDGRPTRRPHRDCGATESQATTSTDMELGIIEGLLAARDLHSLEALQVYVEANGGWAGLPADTAHVSLTYMKPGTRTLLARAVKHLGGAPAGVWASLPIVQSPPGTDFEVHLQVVALAAERQTGNWSPDDELAAANLCSSNPTDAAAQAVCGHTPVAEELVLNPAWTAPSYARGAAGYTSVHKAWILHYLLEQGALDK